MKKKILFVASNDGSDTRINKEIETLSQNFEVIYLGIGVYGDKNFAQKFCKDFYLVQGKRNTIKTTFKHVSLYLKILSKESIYSIHIINEQLMVFFYPFLFHKHVVLDVFDSIFMKKGKPKNKLFLLKKIIYAPVNCILVTDENRKGLMPSFVHEKVRVLENFPNLYKGSTLKRTNKLTIFYFGTLNISRGTNIIEKLLKKNKEVNVIMAGWINDDVTKELISLKNVDFRGIVTQSEASVIAATQADYIMCCYEPSNENNINASPNKIFDAIQTKTPVIINKEVKVSSFVEEENLGVILNSYYSFDVDDLYRELIKRKNDFLFTDENSLKYSWQSIQDKLIKAHTY